MTDRAEALEIVNEFIQNEGLFRHMLSVEAAMRFYARKFGEDEDLWGVIGLLHDFDWEIHPSLEKHPHAGAVILREKGVTEEIIQIILSHADHTGVPRDSLVRKTLYACDEITGLITATALVRPSKAIKDVKIKSIKKKWKNLSFAAGTNREEMFEAFEDFGIEQWAHVGNVLEAMQGIAESLGLEGVEIEE
ncbi:MAG: HDIG domain-containing protein [Chloroflexi bacterium]|jgi:putative nucleotidyltransferase with HDIG domain|nr:HDIG domain-containing protein [Chloroflexota bacterium]MBT3668613.1 HDIG domain-containing protein [Chloroflexota bacterium]MBT4003126.1 HDIG domain-containing protein [Chloroflexota bacterium]MBT4306242.1 HDIG domain-containing protein [Chloroflexota bacterium]MBT4532877.1 HDIG domain-containing protein [Chloroflexota bacterium]